MPRYYFHVRDDDDLILDDEGVELPDLSAARKEAALTAQSLVIQGAESAEPWDHAAIEIWNEERLLEVVQIGALLTGRQVPTPH